MDKADFKQNLIKQIQATDNIRLLEVIQSILALDADEVEAIQLSEEEKQVINQGQEDIRKGNSLTNDQANKEIDEWLKK